MFNLDLNAFLSLIVIVIVMCVKLLFFRYKNKNVAIKVVNKGETPEEIKKREGRFAREVAMLSKVQHKNLVKVVIILFQNDLFNI